MKTDETQVNCWLLKKVSAHLNCYFCYLDQFMNMCFVQSIETAVDGCFC
jgi:hypothetical protein